METSVAVLRSDVASKSIQIETLKASEQSLRHALSDAQQSLALKSRECSSQQLELEKLNDEIAEGGVQNRKLQTLLDAASKGCEDQSARSIVCSAENARLKEQLEHVQSSLSVKIEDQRAELVQLRHALERARERGVAVEKDALEQQQQLGHQLYEHYSRLSTSVEVSMKRLDQCEERVEEKLMDYREKLNSLTAEMVVSTSVLSRECDETVNDSANKATYSVEEAMRTLETEKQVNEKQQESLRKVIESLETDLGELETQLRVQIDNERMKNTHLEQTHSNELSLLQEAITRVYNVTGDCERSVNDIQNDIVLVNKMLADSHVPGFQETAQKKASAWALHESTSVLEGDNVIGNDSSQPDGGGADDNASMIPGSETELTAQKKQSSKTRTTLNSADTLVRVLKEKLQTLRLLFADFTCNARELVHYKTMSINQNSSSSAVTKAPDIQSRELELGNTIKRLVFAGKYSSLLNNHHNYCLDNGQASTAFV